MEGSIIVLTILMILFVVIVSIGYCLFWGFLCSKIAEGKNKNTTLAFWMGFIFSIFAWLWYICIPQVETLHKLYPDKYDDKGKLIKK